MKSQVNQQKSDDGKKESRVVHGACLPKTENTFIFKSKVGASDLIPNTNSIAVKTKRKFGEQENQVMCSSTHCRLPQPRALLFVQSRQNGMGCATHRAAVSRCRRRYLLFSRLEQFLNVVIDCE